MKIIPVPPSIDDLRRDLVRFEVKWEPEDFPVTHVVLNQPDQIAPKSVTHEVIRGEARAYLRDSLIRETGQTTGLGNDEFLEEAWGVFWEFLGGYIDLDERTARSIFISYAIDRARKKEQSGI